MTEVTNIEDRRFEKAHQSLLNMGRVDALHLCSNSFVHRLGDIYREYASDGKLSEETLDAIREIYNTWEEIEKDIRTLK